MKIKLIVVICALWVLIAAPVFAQNVSQQKGEVIHVQALGLVCDFCAQALEFLFMKRSDVESIDVDLSQKRIDITLKEGAVLDDETVRTLIQDAGYNVESIERR